MKKAIVSALVLISLSALASAPKVPCKGTTKSGQACKSTIVSKTTGYCGHHDPNAKRCPAKTSAGKPCGMTTKDGGMCRFHAAK